MKTLVLGCNGQLGVTLAETAPDDVELVGLDLPELDISDADAVSEVCRQFAPELIINAAAYTAVDQAESEPELSQAVNVVGPGNIAGCHQTQQIWTNPGPLKTVKRFQATVINCFRDFKELQG